MLIPWKMTIVYRNTKGKELHGGKYSNKCPGVLT